MTTIYKTPMNFHQMSLDAMNFLTHVTPESFLLGLIVVTGSVYLINKNKAALCIALCGGLYLLPLMFASHIL